MRLGDMLCPWHPGMTLTQCQRLHTEKECESCGVKLGELDDGEDHPPGYWLCNPCAGKT